MDVQVVAKANVYIHVEPVAIIPVIIHVQEIAEALAMVHAKTPATGGVILPATLLPINNIIIYSKKQKT